MDSHDVCTGEPKIDAECVAGPIKKLRLFNVLEIHAVMVVVLNPFQQTIERDPRNKDRSIPMMDHSVLQRNLAAVGIQCLHAFDVNGSASQRIPNFGILGRSHEIHPKKVRSARQFLLNALLRRQYIGLPLVQSPWLERHGCGNCEIGQ